MNAMLRGDAALRTATIFLLQPRASVGAVASTPSTHRCRVRRGPTDSAHPRNNNHYYLFSANTGCPIDLANLKRYSITRKLFVLHLFHQIYT